MDPSAARRGMIPGDEDDSPSSRFRRIARKSALLNAVIVLTSFPILVLAGGSRAVVPALAIMGAISFVIWSATLAVFSCATVGRVLWTAVAGGPRRKPPAQARRAGVADRWLDAPG